MGHPHLRLSIDSQYADASQLYARSQRAHDTAVFFDSEGRPHDPEFASHVFPQRIGDGLAAQRRRKQEAAARASRRLSQTGLTLQGDYLPSDDSDSDDSDEDPFQASRRSSPMIPPMPLTSTSFTHSSGSNSPHSWQQTASLLGETDELPTSSRARRVLRKRPTMVTEMDEDDEDAAEAAEAADEEEVPTCGEAFKRQWQSIILHVTLSAHRAKRRIRPMKEEPLIFNEKAVYR